MSSILVKPTRIETADFPNCEISLLRFENAFLFILTQGKGLGQIIQCKVCSGQVIESSTVSGYSKFSEEGEAICSLFLTLLCCKKIHSKSNSIFLAMLENKGGIICNGVGVLRIWDFRRSIGSIFVCFNFEFS